VVDMAGRQIHDVLFAARLADACVLVPDVAVLATPSCPFFAIMRDLIPIGRVPMPFKNPHHLF